MKRFLQSWAINTLAVLVAVYVVPGIRFRDDSLLTPFVTSLVLGILNAFLRPVMMLLALPLLVFTLGFFMLVINALVLYLVGLLMGDYFEVDGFGSALLGAVIISIVGVCLNLLTGRANARIQVRRGKGRGPGQGPTGEGPGGQGPVIDV